MNQIIAAGIVTFNPDIMLLEKNIMAVINIVKFLVICDNDSSNLTDIKQLIKNIDDSKITLISNGKNKGIAFALNVIMEEAKCQGATWVITLDQDSIVPANIIDSNAELLENSNDIAIISCVVNDRNEVHKKPEKDNSSKYSEVDKCITSASLTNIGIWQTIGKFDEMMFIDDVDIEYCLRAKQNGYRIVRNNDVVLSHAIGNIVEKKLLWLWITVRNHSSFRKYYQIRNLIYMHYKLYGKLSIEVLYRLMSAYFKVIFYEEDKTAKIKRMNQGLKDGLKYKRAGIL